ncbi:MAG: CBS domain-containing protein [Anaerolineales bacterium]|nr:CBS domain-containing protein [Anaerolineales bacterium]
MLILTHENADFDAVASLLAASRLYPEATAVLPRRINRNVQQFLVLYWNRLPFVRPEEWQKRRVDALLLVDTQAPLSIRGVVRHPAVRVIDHHLNHEPKAGWQYQVEAVGATTTLLVEAMQAAGLTLSADEATLLLLGIYEDTGAGTYDTTTARDVRAAAWLLDQGAHLNVVRRFLNIPLTPDQLAIYEQLQTAAKTHAIEGRQVIIAATRVDADFEEEISSIVHRLRDALLPDALLVLVQMGHDVQMVARSSSDGVDVGQVARALGGGGHSRASAALVTHSTLADVQAQVLAELARAVKPQDKVTQIMSYGVQTVPADMKVADAAVLMRRYGYEGYPVVAADGETLVGLLTRRAVDRAVNHDMAHREVRSIMKAGAFTVQPDDSIERVQQLMLQEGWGQIPVVSNGENGRSGDGRPGDGRPGRLIGIVTRTDVLNHLFQPPSPAADADMRTRLEAALQPEMWQMVRVVGRAADELGMPLYFVGGLVRDVLLGLPSKDLDMVVEGDAIRLVERLQAAHGGQLHTHRRFGTAKWFTTPTVWQAVGAAADADHAPDEAPGGLPESIDFVTARTEFYREPSALPEVARGSIKLDLHRRDFTINTLAVRLDGPHLGELLDFYGGRRDLEQGVIRVLHSISFVDDPTRMLRAVRLEQRLGFAIEPRTAELLREALPMLDRVTGDRIRHELELALRERRPAAIMARLAAVGVLAQLHPDAAWQPEMAVAYTHVRQLLATPAWAEALGGESPAFAYFALWLLPQPADVQAALMDRLRVRKATRSDFTAIVELLKVVDTLPAGAPASVVERRLRPFRPRVLLVGRIACTNPAARALIDRYYLEWRHVKTAVDGNDLRDMGYKPGPHFGEWLDALLAARLDGQVSSRDGELARLQQLTESHAAAGDAG